MAALRLGSDAEALIEVGPPIATALLDATNYLGSGFIKVHTEQVLIHDLSCSGVRYRHHLRPPFRCVP